jgi:isopentenyl diphosphate isomerase/L-lactate dehydrogenase-like FMN-dependent dehydrogenase
MDFVARRRFLAYLAGSPMLALAENTPLGEMLNVMDFEAAARAVLPPAHFGYLATGVDDDATLRANRQGFDRFYLRPRRLVDIRKVDLRTELFGTVWDSPIALAPVGNQKAFHAEGEIAVARAAKATKALQVLSTATTTSVEDLAKELGRPPWYQLYAASRWDVVEAILKRVEQTACPVVVWTVDTHAGRRTETLDRAKKLDKRDCVACHGTRREDFFRRKPMYTGLNVEGLLTTNPALQWTDLARLRKLTSAKFVIKGIETREDAQICREQGVDGIIVSNHGGRAEESGRGTIECLPEVIEGAGGLPVMIDGGFRRGTDIFKALALGAKAVFVGRPYIWGLSAYGQAGVEKVLEMLNAELSLVMRQCGVTAVNQIQRNFVGIR